MTTREIGSSDIAAAGTLLGDETVTVQTASGVTRTTTVDDVAARSAHGTVDVRWFDAVEGVESEAEIQAGLDAVGASTETPRLYLPPGDWIAGNLTMKGWGQIVGVGDKSKLTQGDGATGALLTLPDAAGGYSHPDRFTERRTIFDSFAFVGNGSAEPTCVGLHTDYFVSSRMSNLSFNNFGGPGMENIDWCLLGEMDEIIFGRPVDAHLTDSPYWRATGIFNGMSCNRMGLRSLTTDLDGSAAVKFESSDTTSPGDTAAYAPNLNVFTGWWTEFQHTPANGAIFDMWLRGTVWQIPEWWDNVGAGLGGGECCIIRLHSDGDAGPVQDWSGNYLWGAVPGDNNGYDFGIIVEQDRNSIVGTRNYRDNNVRLDAGVDLSYVRLGGQESGVVASGAATNPGAGAKGIIDNSGTTTNTLIDTTGSGAMHILASHVPFQMYDSTGTLRTLQQPTGAGPTVWV